MLANHHKFQSAIILLVAAIAFMVIYNQVFDGKLDSNGDNASYYILGKALANGNGYVNINNINKEANNHFPPGYPVIVSGIIKVFGDSPENLKIANGLFLLLTHIALYFLIKHVTNRESAAIIALLLVIMNSHLLRYSTIIMSEVPFLFFSTATLLAFTKINYQKPPWKDVYLYIVIALLTISFHIRTSGVALIVGILLFLVISRHWKHVAIITIILLLLAMPWQIRSQSLGGSSYIKQLKMVNPYRPELGKANFKDYFSRFGNNINRYLSREIPTATLSITQPNYRQAASISEWLYGIFFFAVIIFGVLNLKKYKLLIFTYLAGTLAILSLWPDVWIGIRFILPAIPFLILGLVNGLQELLIRITPAPVSKYVIWLPVLLIILLFPNIKKMKQQAKAEITTEWANYFSLAGWVGDNLEENTVVACRKPGLFYMYSNCYTVNYKYTPVAQDFINDLVIKHVDYVIMDQLGYSSTSRYLYPVIQNNPEKFELIQERSKPSTYLFLLKD